MPTVVSPGIVGLRWELVVEVTCPFSIFNFPLSSCIPRVLLFFFCCNSRYHDGLEWVLVISGSQLNASIPTIVGTRQLSRPVCLSPNPHQTHHAHLPSQPVLNRLSSFMLLVPSTQIANHQPANRYHTRHASTHLDTHATMCSVSPSH